MATDLRLKEELPELTSRIIETYQTIGKINHLGHCPLPNLAKVIEILDDLKEIIFPGYRRRQNLHFGNVAFHIGDLIDSLHDSLTEQIARALRHNYDLENDCACGRGSEVDFEALGQAKTLEFLDKIPRVRELLASDVQAAYDGDPAATNLERRCQKHGEPRKRRRPAHGKLG